MLCKCCLEILNNNLISEFVFYKCSPIWDNGTMEHALGVVASAHLRPSPPLLDSPVLDMPLLPGSCPHSPFPLTLWLLLVTLPCGPGPSAGECWKAGPNLPGLQSFKSSPKSRFCEWILLIFFFFLLLTPLSKNQSMWASSSQDNLLCFSGSSPLDEGNYCSDPEVTLSFPGLIEENGILIYKNCGE